jgi:signal transduction histidine kinase
VNFTLQAEAGLLSLKVEDNGHGFDRLDLPESECLGMAGMRERASLVGGIIDIQSQPGKGTQVYCRLPIDGKRGSD